MTGLFSFSSDFSELAGLSGPKHPKSLSLFCFSIGKPVQIFHVAGYHESDFEGHRVFK